MEFINLQESYPPPLINVLFELIIKFNGKKTHRTGYYLKEDNAYYIHGMSEVTPYKEVESIESNSFPADNHFFQIIGWTKIK